MGQKVVLITGGSSGIGMETVKLFVEKGCYVYFTYNSNYEAAMKLEGKNCRAIKYCSNDDFEQVNNIVGQIIEEKARIDVLINNLGQTDDNLLIKMSEESFKNCLDINLVTSFNFSKACIKYMSKKKTGSIINLTSIVALTGNIGQANYCAAKAGLIGLTKSMAKEYGRKNILINAIAPGFIKTAMTDKLNDEMRNKMLEKISLQRLGESNEIAELLYFLGIKNSYITGQIISIDGGMI